MKHEPITVIKHTNKQPLSRHIQNLLDRIVATYKGCYGNNLVSVYFNGSVARGEWKAGSDIDVIGFVRQQDFDADKLREQALLELFEDYKAEFSAIEALTIAESQFNGSNPKTNYRLMIMELDGTCLWGQSYDFSFAVPKNAVDFVSRLNATYKNSHIKNKTRAYTNPEGLGGWTKRLAKMGVRLAHGIAMLWGAPFEASYAAKLGYIKQFAPELYDRAMICEKLRHNERFTMEQFELLQGIVGNFIQISEQQGVTFLEPETSSHALV